MGWIVDVSSEGWDITSGEHEDLADGGGLGGLSDKVRICCVHFWHEQQPWYFSQNSHNAMCA